MYGTPVAPPPPAPNPAQQPQPQPQAPAGTVYSRNAAGQHPQAARTGQRPQGTVYGGRPVGFTSPPPGRMEVSGSLTGHILSQGQPDHTDAKPAKSSTGRVVVILAVALGTLVVLGMVVAIFFHDALTNLLKSLFSA
jgi:hypothetical protein